MIKIQTKPFGLMEIDEKQVMDFPRGVLGFETRKRWALLDSPQPPFYWLQSLDEPGLAFIMVDPFAFRPDYQLDLGLADQTEIGNPEPQNVLLFAIVTIPADQSKITANLQGPVVINRITRQGIQAIQTDPAYRTKHYILEELKASGKGGGR